MNGKGSGDKPFGIRFPIRGERGESFRDFFKSQNADKSTEAEKSGIIKE